MQTFISDYDFTKNAANLDNKRLFKQLLEGKQILDVIVNGKKGWANHPAVRQWREHPLVLFLYLKSIWIELQKRKIATQSQLFGQIVDIIFRLAINRLNSINQIEDVNLKMPDWWNREDILRSHRSRLKCKGAADVYCDSIKKALKIKKIDPWLKERFDKTKNQLRWAEIIQLMGFTRRSRIKLIGKNHYNIPKWADIPFDLEYVWPI